MLSAGARRLATVLGVGRGEWPRLLSMGCLFGWVMCGWAMGRAGRDAYFIKEAGTDHLPYMYVLSAALMVGVSAVYAAVVDRVPRYRLMVCLLGLSSAALAGLRLAMPLGLGWTPYAVFCLAEVFTLFFLMHFWTFANQAFDPREGKRLFPLIGGAGLLGGVVGGLLTRPLVAWVGTDDLFLLWATVLVAAVPLTLAAQRRLGDAGAARAASHRTGGGLLGTIAYVRGVPLLRTLSYLSLPMWLVVYIVDYQFFLVMDKVFPRQDQLTGFLGVFNSVTALIGLGLQLFVTGWVLRRFGVGRAVWVHPLGMTLGALALAGRSLLPALPTPRLLSAGTLSGVFAKFSDNAIFYSIGEAASQLLFNALPEEWRGRGRAYIAGVVEPACTAAAGGLLLAAQAFGLPEASLSFLALGLCLLWLGWTRRLKGEYLRALAANLDDADPRRSAEAWEALRHHGGDSAAVLAERIQKDKPEVALLALELLGRESGGAATRAIEALLPNVGGVVRRAVLGQLVRRQAVEALPSVEAVWGEGDAGTRAAAVRAARCLGTPLSRLERVLDDEPEVRTEALIAWLQAGRPPGESLLRTMLAADTATRAWAVYAVGEAGYRPAFPDLLRLRFDPEASVRRRCAWALGRIGGGDAADALVAMLEDPGCAPEAEEACRALGEEALPAFTRLWDQAGPEAGAALARCLGALEAPEATHLLGAGVEDPRVLVAQASARSLARKGGGAAGQAALREGVGRALHRQTADLVRWAGWGRGLVGNEAAALLRDAVERRAATAEGLALECVAALGERQAIEAAVANLVNPQTRVRAEAIEVIESSGEAAHRLVGELELRYLDSGPAEQGPIEKGLLVKLARADLDPWEKACLLYLLRREGVARPEGFFNELEVRNMAANIERILFLKSASLFADVAGSDLPWIDEIAREEEFDDGQIVFREGEMGDSLFIIVEGAVRVLKGEGAPVVLAILGERDCFGEMALLDGEPRSATIETERRSRFLKIERVDFEELLLARPQIGFAMIKNLNRRLRETNARLLAKESGRKAAPG